METGKTEELPQDIDKNEAFPIHANIYDSEMDADSQKPGGFFSKKLYAEEEPTKTVPSTPKIQLQPPGKNGGRDAAFNGICRTCPRYRAHYKLAWLRAEQFTKIIMTEYCSDEE